MMGRLLARAFLIPAGLALAAVTGALVLGSLGLERFTQELHRTTRGSGPGNLGILWGVFEHWGTLRALISAVTILPMLALVIIGEVARIRSALYYVLGGGLAIAVIPALARLEAGGQLVMPPAVLWQVFATAGFAAGFVYWLIAGRSA